MIGAITLTLRQRDGVKKQSIPQQIERKREDAMALRKVESGKGMADRARLLKTPTYNVTTL